MKKFWLFILIALFGGSFAGEPARQLMFKGWAFFLREGRSPLMLSTPPFAEDANDIPVIGKRLDGFASVLLAAAGENAGIQKGDRAIARDDEYVGRVEHVSSSVSQIILASRAGERFAGWLPVLSAPLELEGRGSGLLRASVPASFPIQEGDEVWYDARLDAFVGYIVAVRDLSADKQAGQQSAAEETKLKEILIRQTINPLMLSSVHIIH